MKNLLFSQREGLMPIRKIIQKENFDKETQNALWNTISNLLKTSKYDYKEIGGLITTFIKKVYSKLLLQPLDTIPTIFLGSGFINYEVYEKIKPLWFESEYNIQLDIIELFLQSFPDDDLNKICEIFNTQFKEFNVGYRIIDRQITDITNDEEIKSIETAQEKSSHISKAIRLLYKEKDFENSIKESVSALEEVARKITGKENATFSNCISQIENKVVWHPAFKEMLKKLYGYASDENGIRHANKSSKSKVDLEEAKLILIISSAAVNYLKEISLT